MVLLLLYLWWDELVGQTNINWKRLLNLSKDKLLQPTQLSNGIRVIANFTNTTKNYNKISIPAKSIVILQNNKIDQCFTGTDFK